MPFYFTHADKKLNLEDLPLDRWIAIQEQTGFTWADILSGGTIVGDAKVVRAVVKEVSAHLGVEPPEMTLRGAVDVITFETGETLPAEFADGIPDPKATDTEAETT